MTMPKSEIIKTRIEPELKKEVDRIFAALGLSATEAISLFYYQVKLWKGLPFPIRIPNKKTLKTFKDTDEGKNLVRCKDADDMFRKLGI
jgi:DNA-damage-inducible protein J